MFQHLNPSQATLLLNQVPAGRKLVPIEGTPLARIVRQTIEAVGLTNLSDDKELSHDELLALILSNTKANRTHEEAITKCITENRHRIERQVRYIRNDVRDVIENVFGRVEAALADRLTDAEKYRVDVVSLPEVLSHQVVQEAVKRLGTGMSGKIEHHIFPELTNADIESLITTLAPDDDVKAFLKALPVPMYDIYNAVFRDKRPAQYPTPTQLIAPSNQQFVVIQALFTILLAEAMQNKTPPGVDASKAVLITNLAEIARKQNGVISGLANTHRDAVARGQVFVMYQHEGNKIRLLVNDLAFAEFKEKGGSQHHVIAAMLHGDPHRVSRVVTDVAYKALLEQKHKDYQAKLTLELNEKRSTIVSQVTALEISKLINENEINLSDIGYSKEKALSEMRQVLATTRFQGQEDVYQFVRSVVCRTLYTSINAEYALEGIDKYCAENESFTVREAALLVTRDLLCLWVSSQMELV